MIKKIIFISLIFSNLNVHSYGSELKTDLQEISELIVSEEWDLSKSELFKQDESAELNLVWALWYGNENNPNYDKEKSTKSLEIASRLGSEDAKLLLIGRYLFSSNAEYSNYKRGVFLGEELIKIYQERIDNGSDINGELHRIVGKFYIFGIGVDKDINLGKKYYRIAASLGDQEAAATLSGEIRDIQYTNE